LSQFNLSICFRPEQLGTKPDALTHHWDIYDKREKIEKLNQWPLFLPNQLALGHKHRLPGPMRLQAATLLDTETLNSDIKAAVIVDQTYKNYLNPPDSPDNASWEVNINRHLHFEGQIFIPDLKDLHLRVLRSKYDYLLAGHPGQAKTLQLVYWDYTWPNLRTFVTDYVNSCGICAQNKARHHKPYDILKQLPIPLHPWKSILMDFIEHLPESEGHTDILVVVDRLTKQAIFVPTHSSIDATGLANLFVQNIFSKHRVPSHVMLDRETEFVSKFFRSLAQVLEMRLYFSAGYHPEVDSQTECTNQTLEQYLWIYCNYQQSDWARLLPLAEFTYNNTFLSTTGVMT